MTPAEVAASLPKDFSANSSTVSADTMVEAGTPEHDGPLLQTAATLQGQQLAQFEQQPQQPAQQPAQQPTELQPLPANLQPTQQPAQGQQQPAQQPAADPVATMAASMRAAFPNATAAEIASRVANALAPAQQPDQDFTPEIDPDVQHAEELAEQIATLRQQAQTEGTSDFDQQIADLERQHIKLEARLEARAEYTEREQLTQFAQASNAWDQRASQTFPDADIPGTPLKAAVDARIAEIVETDPGYFSRSADAGFALVAAEAGKLGVSPQIQQQGSPPSPGAPGTIHVPPAMPGSVQGSHRPAQQAPLNPTQQFLETFKAAEQGGLGAEMALAKQIAQGGYMAQGVKFVQ